MSANWAHKWQKERAQEQKCVHRDGIEGGLVIYIQKKTSKEFKEVPVGTMMRPGSGGKEVVKEEEEVVVVVGSIDGPLEALGCLYNDF